ncbi:segregation and condensation protein A [Pseudoclavibacter soli]|uniref:segregation and condensation protein A n=1 Tax=Pseudoclavibacter soli TaxID=452623 RepID=UPI0003F97064|nr:ScpA family protein [Pseudoclavibacter soli]
MAELPEPAAGAEAHDDASFAVRLENFDGPFDLLLQLIGRHEVDVTEVSLSAVTAEFIDYVRALDDAGQLEQASQFIVIAATLLDMKVAGLLPRGEAVDADDIAAFEARDLLFARLLQYRAFKESSTWFAQRLAAESGRLARTAGIDERLRPGLPELIWTTSLDDFAVLARIALAPKAPETIGLAHLHAPAVSIREQAGIIADRLRRAGQLTFTELIADARVRGEIVARFLAVLELFREAAVSLEQLEPLGPLSVRWSAEHWSDEQLIALGAEYDH